jgi:hypothetical protein
MHANEVHAHELYAPETHAYEVYAHEMHTHKVSHVSLKTLVWVPSYLRRLPSNFIKLLASRRVLEIIL